MAYDFDHREFKVKYKDENGNEGSENIKVNWFKNPVEVWNELYPNRTPLEIKRINLNINDLMEAVDEILEGQGW